MTPAQMNFATTLAEVIVGGLIAIGFFTIIWRALSALERSRPVDDPAMISPAVPTSLANLEQQVHAFIEKDETMPLLDVLEGLSKPHIDGLISELQALAKKKEATATPTSITNNVTITPSEDVTVTKDSQ